MKVCMGALILDSMLQKLPNDATSLPSTFATEFLATQDAKVNEPIWQQTKTQGKYALSFLLTSF